MHNMLGEWLHHHRITRFVGFAIMALIVWGCGQSGPRYWPINGRVTFQAKPVANASIRFINLKLGIDVLAKLDADGKYEVVSGKKMGLPEETYQVAIAPEVDISNLKVTKTGLVVAIGPPPPPPRNIPERYHEPDTSALSLTVKPESNTFDVDMQPAK
jgi:hypothetical protein